MNKRMKRGKWYVYEEGKDYKVFDTELEADMYMAPAIVEEIEEEDDIDYGD